MYQALDSKDISHISIMKKTKTPQKKNEKQNENEKDRKKRKRKQKIRRTKRQIEDRPSKLHLPQIHRKSKEKTSEEFTDNDPNIN